jgi:hypothetical protein
MIGMLRRKETRAIMKIAASGMVLYMALGGPAFAQNEALMNAIQKTGQVGYQIASRACHGPIESNNLTGLPGNNADQVRCQSITVMVMNCEVLADTAGSYLHQMQDAQSTFSELENRITNSTAQDAYVESSGLALAKEAPPGTDPAQLTNAVFSACTGLIDGGTL